MKLLSIFALMLAITTIVGYPSDIGDSSIIPETADNSPAEITEKQPLEKLLEAQSEAQADNTVPETKLTTTEAGKVSTNFATNFATFSKQRTTPAADFQVILEYLRQNADPNVVGPVVSLLQSRSQLDVHEEGLKEMLINKAINYLCGKFGSKAGVCKRVINSHIRTFNRYCGPKVRRCSWWKKAMCSVNCIKNEIKKKIAQVKRMFREEELIATSTYMPDGSLLRDEDKQRTTPAADFQVILEYLRQNADPNVVGPVVSLLQSRSQLDVHEEGLKEMLINKAINYLCGKFGSKAGVCKRVINSRIRTFNRYCGPKVRRCSWWKKAMCAVTCIKKKIKKKIAQVKRMFREEE